MAKDIRLTVSESYQDDVYKGIVRVDSSFMKELGIKAGEVIEIEGGRKTVAIVDRAYPGDIGLKIIKMDGLARKNAKTSVGDIVAIRKTEIKPAKKVVIAPAKEGIVVKASPEIFRDALAGRAVVKGDLLSLGGSRARRRAIGEGQFDEEFLKQTLNSFFGGSGFGFGGFSSSGIGDLKFVVVDTNPSKQPVIITETTEIVLNPEAVEVKDEAAAPDITYEDIGGLEDELKKVREMIELPLKHPEIFEKLGVEAPKGVLLHGPPGTGKTLLAKAVANETNSHFILINGPEVMSKFYGESEANLRKTFEEAEKNAPAIIFFDEIDAIASKREETKGEVERRVVAQLLALMDGLKSRGRVVVIAATNVPNILDPALRRPGRFDRELEIGVPNKGGRLNILKIHTRNMPIGDDKKLLNDKEKENLLDELAKITHGFVGADLSALAKEAAMIRLRTVLPDLNQYDKEEAVPTELLEKLLVKKEDFKEALKVVRPSALREVLIETPNIRWTDIGGLEEVKQELKEAVEWPLKHPEAFKRLGVRPPRGILLYGAPGTGKTLLAKAVAKESESNFILVKGPELLSKWVGESEKAVREVFKKARQSAPTIIFFDEIDSLCPRRGVHQGSHVIESVVNQLLTELDGLEELNDVVVLGATNRPDMMDTALLRPGRFDRIILTPVPDEETRLGIFKVHTKGMPLKGVKLEEFAKKTEGYAGADIEAICREAAILALRESMSAEEITAKHFNEALKKVGPSTTPEIEEAYEKIKTKFKQARAKEMKEEKPNYFG